MSKDYKVFIGNIPFDCRESDIHAFFKGFGPIKSVVLKNNYGFCEFVDYYEARDAVKELNGERILGVRVTVEMAKGEFFKEERQEGPSSSPPSYSGETNCVFLGNLPMDCREVDIERFFNGYGKLRQVVLKRGFGFVFFDEQRDADDAVKELAGRKLRGERITLEFAKGDGSDEGQRSISFSQYRIKVENLSSTTSWQDLKDYMKQAGAVLYCKAHHEKKGEGMVEFCRREDMKWAMDRLGDTKLDGRRIKLTEMRG
eukprot:GFUD01018460.1.p1 GENE.GFUD01018460.1~~GFUD01018460.1.p1  ORF type:complete len:270 (-),score=88.59 GFUD01018460.1:268-1038(-)